MLKRQMDEMGPIRVIAFDFDGVLADSVPIKDAAFHHLFRHHDEEIQSAALNRWNNLKGVFRRDRIQSVYREVLGVELEEKILNGYVRQFETEAFERTVAAPWIPGGQAFLEKNVDYPLYIVSASPQEEVREVALRRKMAHHFKEIYGGPVKKTAFLMQILQQEECAPHALLFIGDSISDYRAAFAVKTTFLGIVAEGKEHVFPEQVPVHPDLTALDLFLQRCGTKP